MKGLLRLFIFLSYGVLLSQCATTGQKMTFQVLEINDSLNSLFKNPPPGAFFKHSFLDEKIVFISRSQKLLFALHKGEVAQLPFETWQEKIPKSNVSFDMIKDQERQILVIYLDLIGTDKDEILETILHEGFHAFVQQGNKAWKPAPSGQGRGTIYPILSLPRYFRYEMQQSLLEYFRTKQKEPLQYFSYWFWKWRTNFLEEYRNYTDRTEGSAEYFTKVMMARHKLKDPSEESFFQYFQSTPLGKTNLKEEFNLEMESYYLGPLIGFALDQANVEAWQEKVMQGASPFDLLEKSVLRKRKTNDQIVLNEFLRISVREMTKIDREGKLDQVISNLANPTTHRLILPSKGTQSTSFAAKDMFRPFFNFKGLMNIQVVALDSAFTIEHPQWTWNYQAGDYWIRTETSPCSTGSGSVIVFKQGDIDFQKGQLSFKNIDHKPIPVKRKKRGYTNWYCPI